MISIDDSVSIFDVEEVLAQRGIGGRVVNIIRENDLDKRIYLVIQITLAKEQINVM